MTEQATVARCVCGKPLDHVDADPDSSEWACWVPDPDHRPISGRDGWQCSCGLLLGGDWGTPSQWHALHLAEHVKMPDSAERYWRDRIAAEIEGDPFWTGARHARAHAAAIARGASNPPELDATR